MRLVFTIATLISIYTPAAAFSPCDDLWFTRNLLFARNGYCFASPLGQAVFGNAGCFTSDPGLDAQERDVLADVRDREKALECHVDNQRQQLDVDLIEQRKQMLDLPYATEFEAACVGWLGPALPIHNASHVDSHVIGHLQKGDQIDFFHEELVDEAGNDWFFITQRRQDTVVGIGWVFFGDDLDKCEMFAG